MRKVAWRLIPFLSIGYMINALDRFNVSMAALTMNKDLGLTASAYGLGAGAFFWSYILFQFPASLAQSPHRMENGQLAEHMPKMSQNSVAMTPSRATA